MRRSLQLRPSAVCSRQQPLLACDPVFLAQALKLLLLLGAKALFLLLGAKALFLLLYMLALESDSRR